MSRAPEATNDRARQGRCLTEMSVIALIAGALGLSAFLWTAILAVI